MQGECIKKRKKQRDTKGQQIKERTKEKEQAKETEDLTDTS